MSFVTRGQSQASIKEALIEKSFQEIYNYFVGELAKSPTTLTKIRLVNESEAMSSGVLAQVWTNLYSCSTSEKKSICQAALLDSWLQLPKLSREFIKIKEDVK